MVYKAELNVDNEWRIQFSGILLWLMIMYIDHIGNNYNYSSLSLELLKITCVVDQRSILIP